MAKNNAESITLEEAVRRIKERTDSLPVIKLALEKVNGETAANDIFAVTDQPPFPRSPLDGYALRGEDSEGASPEQPVRLKVIDRFCAGEYRKIKIQKGECIRIMTGAPIPPGADAVIRQEDTDYGSQEVCLYRQVRPWENYCYQGEDFKEGDLLIPEGTVLDYSAVAVLASNGVSKVPVYRKPKVAVLATGDELVQPGEPLRPGKIYNSNLYTMRARLRELGIACETAHIADNKEAVKEAIQQWNGRVDAIITTGGVSVGEKDIMNKVLPELEADIVFDGVAMKPGGPVKYALYEEMPILALSGNPFAASATMEVLGRPMLAALMCSQKMEAVRTTAILGKTFPKASKGRRLIRGKMKNGVVLIPKGHSSGQIFSMLGCNCLVDIPAGTDALEIGSRVEILML